MKKQKHYWLCALTGLLAGFVAVFISTHHFEFFWPFNWPVKITSAAENNVKAITVTSSDTRLSIVTDYLAMYEQDYVLPVGTRVLAWRFKNFTDLHSRVERQYGRIIEVNVPPDMYKVTFSDGQVESYSLHEFIEIYPKDPVNSYARPVQIRAGQ